MYAVNAINELGEQAKKIEDLQKEMKDLSRDVSSVNSKINLAIPDARRPYNRS